MPKSGPNRLTSLGMSSSAMGTSCLLRCWRIHFLLSTDRTMLKPVIRTVLKPVHRTVLILVMRTVLIPVMRTVLILVIRTVIVLRPVTRGLVHDTLGSIQVCVWRVN